MDATDVVDFQRFVNIGVDMGVVKTKVDVRTFMKAY